MDAVAGAIGSWWRGIAAGWNNFWFRPAAPHMLCLIRILAGAMLFYTHLVWALDLQAFLGPESWIKPEVARALHSDATSWSYLWYVRSPTVLWTLHVLALLVFAMLTVGLFTRVVSILAWLITVAYAHRLIGALFGLDQINVMLAMYLMIGPSGATLSLDRLIRRWRGRVLGPPQASVGANMAIRLIQLHMCIIYLFSAVAKLQGRSWRDGGAIWYAVANLEYQSLDLTWLVHYPLLIALLTHVTVFWELFYCFLVWPRATRPLMLSLAVAVHGGIAVGMGMFTFGLAMLIGNLAFVSPAVVQRIVEGRAGRKGEE